MLINKTPDVYDKVQVLGGMAMDDVLGRDDVKDPTRVPYPAGGKRGPLPGVYKAAMPNGKTISLFRVMFTDFCKMDCYYCPNSHWVPRKRYGFKVDELARMFMDLQRREVVSGLFLSSGIAGTASKTTEKLIKVVDLVRNKYGFKGYIHLKVMPGTEYGLVEAAHRLGSRLSVNMETPQPGAMGRLSGMKDLERDILAPMNWIAHLTKEKTGGAVGQATQLVVGAANEPDSDILRRISHLYGDWNVKRVYYSGFRPVLYTPLAEHAATPAKRTQRLYQMDWLKRVYGFSDEELLEAFDDAGFLPLSQDPKTVIAMNNLDAFPVDLSKASREELLRVPGIGPKAADRIEQNRARHRLDNWRDLQALGVVRKWAWPFVVFPGHRPNPGRQLMMDMFGVEQELEQRDKLRTAAVPASSALAKPAATTPCGIGQSCAGCSLFGTPGHPGYSPVTWKNSVTVSRQPVYVN